MLLIFTNPQHFYQKISDIYLVLSRKKENVRCLVFRCLSSPGYNQETLLEVCMDLSASSSTKMNLHVACRFISLCVACSPNEVSIENIQHDKFL